MRAAVELALDADGRILALRGRILADLGAYLLPSTPIPPHTTAMLLAGCYDIQAVEVFVTGARTNKVPTAPYRGAGRPEASYLIETTIDAAARELGIDPVELRRRNLVRAFPYRTALGWTYDSGDFERCLDTALELLGRSERRRPPRRPADGGPEAAGARPLVGAPPSRRAAPGVALSSSARRLFEHAEVTRDGDDVVVSVGSMPVRPGPRDAVRADRRRPARRRARSACTVRTGDTDALADGVGSFASRSTAMGGSAVAAAADDLLARRARATRASSPTRSSPRARTPRWSRSSARPARCACGGWSRSTTPGGSSTRCWPRARWSAARCRGSARA